MELRHLRYFVSVAEHLNFSRAAEALATAQPSLSQQIRQLEDELGVELFSRDKRQIALTTAGAEFLRDVRVVLAQLDTAVTYAREAQRGVRGELRIGYTGAAMLGTLPAAIRAFRSGHPDVRITLSLLHPAALFEALRNREVDAGAMLDGRDAPRRPGIDMRRLAVVELGVALPNTHRLAGRRAIRLEELAGETLLLYARRHAGLYDVVLEVCRERGLIPERVEELDRIETIMGLIAAGEGVSIGPRVFEELQFPGVSYTPITPASKPLVMVVARNSEARSTLVDAFVATYERTKSPDGEK
jgi:DNA-binding transcriptional LysR family regulator